MLDKAQDLASSLKDIKPTLNQNIFTFNENGSIYLYYPHTLTFIKLNKDMFTILKACNGVNTIEQLIANNKANRDSYSIFKSLLKKDIIIDRTKVTKQKPKKEKKIDFRNRIAIFPTTACNIRCKYCYANGGDNPQYMPDEIYKTAIDYFICNHTDNSGEVNLSLHGGGEPTINFNLIQKIYMTFLKKCKNKSLKPNVGITSNGVFNLGVRKWIFDKKIGLSISMDGLEKVQNLNRPYRNGKPTFMKVMGNITYFIKSGREMGIRSTVTSKSLSSMKETINFAKANGISSVHFEPVYNTERGLKNSISSPNPKDFVEEFLDCFMLGLSHDIEVTYSGLRCYDVPQERFCSAAGQNFVVTTNGDISCCYEVMNSSDPASKLFFIGKVLNNDVVLFEEKISYLKNRITDNLPRCSNCFLKFSCAGDCLAKAFRNTGDIFSVDDDRCYMTKSINKKIIMWIADGVIEPRDQKYKSVSFTC